MLYFNCLINKGLFDKLGFFEKGKLSERMGRKAKGLESLGFIGDMVAICRKKDKKSDNRFSGPFFREWVFY